MLRVMEHCALESSERQHYAMVVAMLQGRYDDSDAWPIAGQFIRSLRVSDSARCMQGERKADLKNHHILVARSLNVSCVF